VGALPLSHSASFIYYNNGLGKLNVTESCLHSAFKHINELKGLQFYYLRAALDQETGGSNPVLIIQIVCYGLPMLVLEIYLVQYVYVFWDV
jgi:hypothetical protein